jgi:hypothetical protein
VNLPTPIPYSSINPGQVFSPDLTVYLMASTPTQAVNLQTGAIVAITNPATVYTVFPAAALVLG